ncbi:MAG: NRDE family protein [Gemmatimonadota bacterium]|nr:NRDE family protein [Gemmatimonadota bacterium]
MCTVSWLRTPGGYSLCCNRDERFTRAPALPPAVREQRGVPYLAPLDGDFGGSWLAVNAFGLTLSLLNRYRVEGYVAPAAPLSRGLLLLDLIVSPAAADARSTLTRTDLHQVQPFTLIIVAPDSDAHLARWDGEQLAFSSSNASGLLATSSAVSEPEVAESRIARFSSLAPVTLEGLEALHRSHLPERGRLSICMHRTDAETQSYSRVSVTSRQVTLAHTGASPCREVPPVSLNIPRRIATIEPVR